VHLELQDLVACEDYLEALDLLVVMVNLDPQDPLADQVQVVFVEKQEQLVFLALVV